MSNIDINLVSNKNIELGKEFKRLKIIRNTALASLIIVLFLSVLFFILNLTLPFGSIKKDEQLAEGGISLLYNKQVTYAMINDRVTNISNVIAKRKNYMLQLNAVLGKLSSDLTIEDLEIQSDKINISVSGASLVSMNKFIDDMVALGNQGKIIKNIMIEGLSLNSGNEKYTLSIQANIK
jgi:hypothetical protein